MTVTGATRRLCFLQNYRTKASFPSCDSQPSRYEGPSYERIRHIRATHFPPAVYTIYKKPLLLHEGRMQWLFDHTGKRYLDLFGGIVTVSVGHCHPKIVSAMIKQVKTLWHTTNIYYHPSIHEYAEKLASTFPGNLKVVYLVNSGTEANDLAMLLARAYTGNQDIVTLRGCYHGYSSSMMALTATQMYRLPMPVPGAVHHAMIPDPYRGIWGGCRDSISQVNDSCLCPDECAATDKYIAELNEIFQYSIPAGRAAAVFAESIQGVGGCLQFTKGYLKRALELVHKNGGLFVADEVQTGFGRTGDHFWGFEGHGIQPDIVTLAKGIGNGFPLGAVVTTPEIAAAHTKATYFNTFGGNPLASTAGKAVLDIIEEEELQSNSKNVGYYLLNQLIDLQKKHEIIGDVRGKGLMVGLELTEPGTKDPLNISQVLDICETAKDMGVLFGRGGRYSNVLRIKPPMCIRKADVDYAVSVLDHCLERAHS